MRNIYLLRGLFFCFSLLNAQEIYINFENEQLANWYSPNMQNWQVSDNSPVSGNYSLKHIFDSPESADDWIVFFHDPLVPGNVEQAWEFTVRYDFTPSANNNWSVILGKDCLLPKEKLKKALVMGVNYEGSDDVIKVWQINEGKLEILINTGINWEENKLNSVPVKFSLRYSSGKLMLETDIDSAASWQTGQSKVQPISGFNSFLVYYKYSSTYDRGLAIDEIKIGGSFGEDNSPPNMGSAQLIARDKLELLFDEPVIVSSVFDFCIENIGCSKAQNEITNSLVLNFENEFRAGLKYNIELPLLEDLAGNILEKRSESFYYPSAYDVIINEIMADPTPEVLLPNAEYVELFNRTDDSLPLNRWNLSVNGRSSLLPECIIPPQGYLLLTDKENAVFFEEFDNLIGVESFPSIHNGHAEVLLLDRMNSLMHAIINSSDWHEPEKLDGGWSIELINPSEACNEYSNWTSSADYRGGTPGELNSVYSEELSIKGPNLWRASMIGSNALRLYFSSGMDSLSSSSTDFFLLKPDMTLPRVIQPSWPIVNSIDLEFENDFLPEQEYQISLSKDPTDCGGRILQQSEVSFMMPQAVSAGDIVINEIMFDPQEGFNEYIELYNGSDKAIEIHNWKLQIEGKEAKIIMPEYFALLPKAYYLISKSLRGINTETVFSEAEKIIHMPDLPFLVNSSSSIILLDSTGAVIDQGNYDPDWHHELVENSKGVAMERLSADASGMEEGNWSSAGSHVNYQTPGALNSQTSEKSGEVSLFIEPKTITPNDDGWNDVLQIHYTIPQESCMGKILIFDMQGRLVRSLANGSLLSTHGIIEYDGRDHNAQLLPVGFYILYFEAYNEKGFQFFRKKSFVIANTK